MSSSSERSPSLAAIRKVLPMTKMPTSAALSERVARRMPSLFKMRRILFKSTLIRMDPVSVFGAGEATTASSSFSLSMISFGEASAGCASLFAKVMRMKSSNVRRVLRVTTRLIVEIATSMFVSTPSYLGINSGDWGLTLMILTWTRSL